MTLLKNIAIAGVACLVSANLMAADLSGFWQPEGQAAWIEIQFDGDTGIGTVRRNDNNPEAVGRVIFKDVVSDADNPGSWRGQIYAAKLKEFKDAVITLPDSDNMQIKVKVGFMSRTVHWARAEGVPAD